MKKFIFLLLFISISLCACSQNFPKEYMGLRLTSVVRYDKNGNMIYHNRGKNAGETIIKYNSKNQQVKLENKKLKSSVETKYHSNGNKSYEKNIDNNKVSRQVWYDENGYGIKTIGFKGKTTETKNEYNADGKITHRIRTDGTEIWYEYNSTGYKVYTKTDIDECWQEYDSHDNLIYEKTVKSDGKTEETKLQYDYNESGKITHFKNFNTDSEYWNEYTEDGKLVYSKSTPLSSEKDKYAPGEYVEMWNEFGENGKCIYKKYSDGREAFYEYDDAGNMIYYKNTSGNVTRYMYEFYSDGKIKEKREYS